MSRLLILFFVILINNFSLLAKDAPDTYQIKGNLSVGQKAQYEQWTNSVIFAFNAVGPGRKLDFTPIIIINSKKNSWPYNYVFYEEDFFGCQPVKFTRDTVTFDPIKEVYGLANNEFAFKQVIANYLVCNNLGKNIPYWFEKGFSSCLASKSGAKDWLYRNYSYILFLSTERKEFKTIEQILDFKFKLDNKERFLQETYSWALIDWLMNQKEYLDSSNKILALSNTLNIQSFSDLKNENKIWIKFIETKYSNQLPLAIKIASDCQTILDQDDLKGLFFTIKKKNTFISDDYIAAMLGVNIHPTTLKNIIALIKSQSPVIREVAVRALGIIADRTALSDLIIAAYSDPAEEVRYGSANSIRKLNLQIAPKDLINALSSEDPILVAQAAISLAIIGDTATAKNMIQKLSSLRPSTNLLEITKTRNYISDYDVIDGVYDPVISTYQEGIVVEETILWVVEVRSKLILALNRLPLNYQGQTEALWFKWYATQ